MSRIFKLISLLQKTQRNYGTVRNSKTYYELLKVSEDASKKDIRLAFLKLSKEVHPDTSAKSDKTSHDEFIKINEAYNVLSKDHSRQQYDIDLKYNNNPYKSTFRPENKTTYYYAGSMAHSMRYDKFRENYRSFDGEYYRNRRYVRRNRNAIDLIWYYLIFFGIAIQIIGTMVRSPIRRVEMRNDLQRHGKKNDRNRSQTRPFEI